MGGDISPSPLLQSRFFPMRCKADSYTARAVVTGFTPGRLKRKKAPGAVHAPGALLAALSRLGSSAPT